MHDLTEVDEFTTPVTVPDGIDARATAAEVVAAIAQALANRTTRHELHAAFKNAANTFTQPNTFDDDINAKHIEVVNTNGESAALVVRSTADDDPHPGNKYHDVLGFALGGGLGYCNVYSGTDTSEYQFVITLNAVWNTGGQDWTLDDGTHAAIALLFDQLGGGVRLSRKPSGSGPWTTWPLNDGDLAVGGDLAVIGEAVVTGDSKTSGHFKYVTPPTRTTAIQLLDVQGKYLIDENSVKFDPSISAGDFPYALRWPIRPVAGQLGAIQVRTNTVSSGGADVFWINQRRHAFTTGLENNVYPLAPGSSNLSGGKAHSLSGGGVQTVLLIPLSAAQDGDEYELVWQVNSISDLVALGSNEVIAIERVWSDVGPLNDAH